MSVILIKKEKESIIVGADSQETSGESRQENIYDAKLRKIEDGVYIAGAGDGHIYSMLCAYAEENSLKEINTAMNLIKYFYKFNEWIMEIVTEEADMKMPSPLQRSQYILIIDGRIWYFAGFYVREINEGEFHTIGSGSQAAAACMNLGVTIEEALKATCKVDIYCSEPIKILEITYE